MNRVTHRQRGFTLLELIVVVGLLGLMTSLATDYMVNETNQQRYDVTKKRLEQIRYAILGDPSRELNGQPTYSGYIADTGSVPKYLSDLLRNNYCASNPVKPKASCVEWREIENWNGPYLTATDFMTISLCTDLSYNNQPACLEEGEDWNTVTVPVFRDGWGNRNQDIVTDTQLSGWFYSNDLVNIGPEEHKPSNGDDIFVRSKGLDGESSSDTAKNRFEHDYPSPSPSAGPLIYKNRYAGKKVEIDFTTNISETANRDFCITYITPEKSDTIDLGTIDFAVEKPTIEKANVFGTVEFSVFGKAEGSADCSNLKPTVLSDSSVYAHNILAGESLEIPVLVENGNESINP